MFGDGWPSASDRRRPRSEFTPPGPSLLAEPSQSHRRRPPLASHAASPARRHLATPRHARRRPTASDERMRPRMLARLGMHVITATPPRLDRVLGAAPTDDDTCSSARWRSWSGDRRRATSTPTVRRPGARSRPPPPWPTSASLEGLAAIRRTAAGPSRDRADEGRRAGNDRGPLDPARGRRGPAGPRGRIASTCRTGVSSSRHTSARHREPCRRGDRPELPQVCRGRAPVARKMEEWEIRATRGNLGLRRMRTEPATSSRPGRSTIGLSATSTDSASRSSRRLRIR